MFDRTNSTIAHVDPEIAAAIPPRTGARKSTSS